MQSKKTLLLTLVLLFLSPVVWGQITTKYQQSFESSGEAYGYSIISGNVRSTAMSSAPSGSNVLYMRHTATDAVVVLDTIDFTENSSYSYFVLSLMHVSTVNPLDCQTAAEVGLIEVKRPNQTDASWVPLTSSYYDRTWGGGSSDYAGTGSFSNRSYPVWSTEGATTTGWKGERFNLNNLFQGVPLADKKLLVRFTLKAKATSDTTTNGWYIDGISVKASPMSMVSPILSMMSYPDLVDYPTSRSTRIEGRATTTVQQGLSSDSMYIEYRYGANGTTLRTPFAAVQGGTNLYRGYIPFCGYDTMVYYRVIVKDATTNANSVSFPFAEGAWERYRSVRFGPPDGLWYQGAPGVRGGSELNVAIATANLSNQNLLPFSSDGGDSRTQIIYDSAVMAAAGYGPGAITALSFMPAGNASNQRLDRMQIKMRNVEGNVRGGASFYGDSMKVVYDGAYTLNASNGSWFTITLQDTFFYAGHNLLVVFTIDQQSTDPSLSVQSVATAQDMQSLYVAYPAQFNFDPFDAGYAQYYGPSAQPTATPKQPNLRFRSHANLPLVYDCGVSGFVTPNDSTSANALSTNLVNVTLKNYGASPITNVRLWYNVDGGAARYYDWSGNLAAGATTNVTLYTSQNYSAGYHEIMAWVDDSVTSGGALYRDHEPLNDTLKTHFIACAGAFNGQRQVGGTGADYATLENMLYALRECGVNGALTVKLAPGTYQVCEFPTIAGLSNANYVQFEPLNGQLGSVEFVLNSNAQSLVDLQRVSHIRFKNIVFKKADDTYSATYLVELSRSSVDVRFEGCQFIDSSASRNTMLTALLFSAGTDNLRVSRCYFYQGFTGVSLVGPSSANPASGNNVSGSTFANQVTNAINLRNQYNAVIDSNSMNDVQDNQSYLLLVQDCSGAQLRITRNRIYSSRGAGCMGITGLNGMLSGSAVVANNMITSLDDGSANVLKPAFHIITADYVKFVYNSVKLVAPQRNGIAAASFGGPGVNHCDFYNNIITCYDHSNYALDYTPNTSSGAVNNIGYNIYYSTSGTMNRYSGTACPALGDWRTFMRSDGNSLSGDPHFLGSTPTDLRSYNDIVKNHGTPVSEVGIDLFGTQRNATTPCIGAFEFVALNYDFEISQLLSPLNEYCDVPTSAPLRFVVRNSGSQRFNPANDSLTIYYSRNQCGTLSPTNSGTIRIQRAIPANDTIIVTAPNSVSFPLNGIYDSTYTFYIWTSCTIDPNEANDTGTFAVTARYRDPAPTPINQNVQYATSATITVTGGITTWYPQIYTSGRNVPGTVYWYTSQTSTTPFHVGNTYTTPVLYDDTTFYIRQSRDMAMVKIAEVQVNRTGDGATTPMPAWINTQSQKMLAVELVNVGDYPADLAGDTLQLVGQLSDVRVLPHLVLQPGQSVVVQYRTSVTTPDSLTTFGAGVNKDLTNYYSDFGIIYRDGHGVADAVAFNNGVGQSAWSNQRVPSAVWAGGTGITLTSTTAGVYRKSWPTNPSATPANTYQYWQVADASNPMTLGTTNSNLIRFTANNCQGGLSPVRLTITGRPTVDLTVDSLVLPSGCGLGNELISVNVNNFGIQNSGAYTIHFSVNGTLVATENVSNGVPNGSSVRYTFSTPANFTANTSDRTFNVKVWVSHLSDDYNINNDTVTATTTSTYTPTEPNVTSPQSATYGQALTLTPSGTVRDTIVWYDRNHRLIDTMVSLNTGYLYATDTFYVGAIAATLQQIHIGTLATVAAVGDNASPFNFKQKYGRGQYLYTADELQAAGHSAGPIKSISFYVEAVTLSGSSIAFDDYSISFATMPAAITTFGSNSWIAYPTTEYYQSNSFTISTSDAGHWKTIELSRPFMWDGVSNIVVQVCHTINTPNTQSNQGVSSRYTNAPNTALVAVNAQNNLCDPSSSVNPGRQPKRPDIQFGFVDYGCVGPLKEVIVNVSGAPSTDGHLSWPDGSDTATYTSCAPTSIDVKITNNGVNPITQYNVNYWIDNVQQPTITNTSANIASRQSVSINLASQRFSPGRHSFKAVLMVPGDGTSRNDTVERTIHVRFCAGVYTIGASGNYADFTTAIDTLNQAGVAGAVVFNVQTGTYDEQIVLGRVEGMSATNYVMFRSATGDSTSVVLRYSPTSSMSNYVMLLNGAAHYSFQGITFYGNSTATAPNNLYSDVIHIENSNNITFRKNRIKVKRSLYFANANPLQQINACGMVIGDNVTNITVDNNTFDSAYYAIRSVQLLSGNTHTISITNNKILNFWVMGVQMRKVDNVSLSGNTVTAGCSVAGKPLHGFYVAEHNGMLEITGNRISLVDTYSGGKRAIYLSNCRGTASQRSRIYNNMASVSSAGTAGISSSAIWIDSSTNINVFFNTTYLFAGNTALATRSFNVSTTSSGIQVINNVFSNFSSGYAYYVQNATNVSTSNYNNYYSNPAPNGAGKYAFWGSDCSTLAALRSTNSQDANSLDIRPYFVNDYDLHLAVGSFVELGQYNGEVQYDIDGTVRPQIPGPTIGAHEFTRVTHDLIFLEVHEPYLDVNARQPKHIETDSVPVIVMIYNNGTSVENNVQWYGEVVGCPTCRSATRTISQIPASAYRMDTLKIPTALGVIDTQLVRLHLAMDTQDITFDTLIFLHPAFNLRSMRTEVTGGCYLTAAPVNITVKNEGKKAMPAGTVITIGYEAILLGPAGVTVPNLPTSHTESYTLTQPILVDGTDMFTFATPVDIYPHTVDQNIIVRMRSWVSYQYDLHPENDTSSYTGNINSYYTPQPPQISDVTIPYGTWDTLRATQANNLAIMWFRDTTQQPFFAPSNVQRSWWWRMPMMFSDSTYYLASRTAQGCTSYYSPVHVHVVPSVAYDAAVKSIVSPTNRVYMYEDTVKVRIINFGLQPFSNIPVTYQIRRSGGGQPLQTVSEVCPATVQPGDSVVYTFDSLVQIPQIGQVYSVRAWTSLPNEMTPMNDTLMFDYSFTALAQTAYCAPMIAHNEGLDITRVSYGSVDNSIRAAGYEYVNFGDIDALDPGVPVIRVSRGFTDTLIVECEDSEDPSNDTTRAYLTVYVDYNRDGQFDPSEIITQSRMTALQQYRYVYTIPNSAFFGYMRMRLILQERASSADNGCANFAYGHVQDYLLYVEGQPKPYDLAIGRIVSPRNAIMTTDRHAVSFILINNGSQPVTTATINYRYDDENPSLSDYGQYQWQGNLAPGYSTIITLDTHTFDIGTTNLCIYLADSSDANHDNDSTWWQYHLFETVTLAVNDNFEGYDRWYAPRGYNRYTENYWQRGRPSKQSLNAARSGDNAWVTLLSEQVVPANLGNVSMLYSPVIDISQIRPDTISFYLKRVMEQGTALTLEYLSWTGKWEIIGSSQDTMWYNSPDGFTGNANVPRFIRQYLSTTDYTFPTHMQFRFVFRATLDAVACPGVAIDDFKVGRARRAVDVGVTAITQPISPQLGQVVHPRVALHNYGYDTVHTIVVRYTHFGANIPKESTWTGTLAPDATTLYTIQTPFTITSDFPDTFSICAFTWNSADIYYDNDSTCKDFVLSPLEDDMNLMTFVAPNDRVVGGDSATITVRLRNFGQNTVNSTPVTYVFNGGRPVTETVDFNALLGRPLSSMEAFNYSFHKRVKTSMGSMSMLAYSTMQGDTYAHNDTISKRILGIGAITDLKAKEIVTEQVSGQTRVQLVISNVGARGANNFLVGYYYDDDPTTAVVETYYRADPLAALTDGYHIFTTRIPGGGHTITAFVHIDNDNDISNDTTSNIVAPYVDIRAIKVQIEEMRSTNCRSRMVIENVGNFICTKTINIHAVVNGTELSATTTLGGITKYIEPGREYYIELGGYVPRNSTRVYQGMGQIVRVEGGDPNNTNDQTTFIEVLNFFEDIPLVPDADDLVLEQNYPNPFNNSTRIDFSIPAPSKVRFFVIDATGRMVYQQQQQYDAGAHSIDFSNATLPAGIYYYGIECDDKRLMRKMIYAR